MYRSYRVLGFIILGCSIIACLCIRERVKTADKTTKLRQIFDFEVLKDLNFVLWVLGSMIGLMGFFVPYFFLPCKYFTCVHPMQISSLHCCQHTFLTLGCPPRTVLQSLLCYQQPILLVVSRLGKKT